MIPNRPEHKAICGSDTLKIGFTKRRVLTDDSTLVIVCFKKASKPNVSKPNELRVNLVSSGGFFNKSGTNSVQGYLNEEGYFIANWKAPTHDSALAYELVWFEVNLLDEPQCKAVDNVLVGEYRIHRFGKFFYRSWRDCRN